MTVSNDLKPSFGNILTIIAMIVGFAASYFSQVSRNDVLDVKVTNIENSIARIEDAAQDRYTSTSARQDIARQEIINANIISEISRLRTSYDARIDKLIDRIRDVENAQHAMSGERRTP